MYATACARPREKITTESKSFAGNAFGLFRSRGFFSASQAMRDDWHHILVRLALDSGPKKNGAYFGADLSPFACPGETRCRLIPPREAPATNRASARAGAGSAACAGHAERGGHRPRPTRGSFRDFRRSSKRASRSVRPASTPAFPSAPREASISSRRIAIARLGGSSASRGIERNEARGERELTLAAVPRVPDVAHRVFRVAQARRRPNAPPASSASAFAERLFLRGTSGHRGGATRRAGRSRAR